MASASFSAAVPASPAMARACRGIEAADEPALRDVPAGRLNASVPDLSRFLLRVSADSRPGEPAVLAPDRVAEMPRVHNDGVALGPLAESGEVVRWRTRNGQPRARFAGLAFSLQGR